MNKIVQLSLIIFEFKRRIHNCVAASINEHWTKKTSP